MPSRPRYLCHGTTGAAAERARTGSPSQHPLSAHFECTLLRLAPPCAGREGLRPTHRPKQFGLRFVAQGPLEPGLKLDIAIDWPVLLDDRVHLQLTATGVVVRCSGNEVALQIERHDFRTRSERLNVASR